MTQHRVKAMVASLVEHDTVEKALIRRRRSQGWLAWHWQSVRQALLVGMTWILLPSWGRHNRLEVVILDQMAKAKDSEVNRAIAQYDQSDGDWL